MFEALLRLLWSIPDFILWAMEGLWRVAINSWDFMVDTFRAHYNVAGKHTAPLEQELLGKKPEDIPSPSKLNILGQIALSIIPVTLIAWFCSLVLFPLIYNTFQSFFTNFKRITNLPLLDLPENAQLNYQDERSFYRQIYGLLGLGAGAFFGAIAATGILLARIVSNTFKNFVTTFSKMLNYGLNTYKIPVPQFEKSALPWKILGSTGYLLGGLAGGIGLGFVGVIRVLMNSWETGLQTLGSAINLVRKEKVKNDLFCDDARTAGTRYGLGFPGIFLGVFAGPFAFAAAALERTAVESWKALRSTFVSGLNLAFSRKNRIKQEESKLEGWDYLFAVPGLFLGYIAGGLGFALISFGKIISNSWESFLHAFASVTNLALDKKDELQSYGHEKDKRRSKYSIGFGLPGLVTGFILGWIGYLGAGIFRICQNSWKKGQETLVLAVNLARKEKIANDLITNFDKTNWRNYLLGLPGIILAIPFGMFAFMLSCTQRSLLESTKAMSSVSISALNLALHPENQIKQETTKLEGWDYLFALPGLFLGVVVGSLGFLAIACGRILTNSWKSFLHAFASVTNLALDKKYEIQAYGAGKDERGPKYRIGFGWPGLAAGYFLGWIGFLGAGIGRIVANSWIKGIQSLAFAINLVRKEEIANDLLRDFDRKKWLDYLLGSPGIVLAMIPGIFAFLGAVIERIVIESWKIAKFVTIKIWNVVLPETISENTSEEALDFPFGFFGLPFGIIVGAIGFIAISVNRMFMNFNESFMNMTASMINLVLEEEDQIKRFGLDKDAEKRAANVYFLLPGYAFGFVAGIVSMVSVGLARGIVNSWKVALQVIVLAVNIVRKDGIKYNLWTKPEDFKRSIRFGFPGLVVGAIMALPAMGIVLVERSIIEGWKTAKFVTLGLWNYVLPELMANSLDQPSFDVVLGCWGAIPGVIVGGLGFAAIFTGRVITNSVLSFLHMAVTLTNTALEVEIQDYGLRSDKRLTQETYGFGVIGLGFGFVAGVASASLVFSGRMIMDSWKAMLAISAMAFNRMRKEPITVPYLNEKNPYSPFYIGVLGTLAGIFITGPLAFAASCIERAALESWESTKAAFIRVVNTVLKTEIPPDARVRDGISQFFGLTGLLFGVVAGGIAAIGIGFTRFMTNTWVSFVNTSTKTVNIILPVPLEEDKTERSSADHAFGFVGVALGVLTGAAGIIGIGFVRMLANSAKSFAHTFLSMVNAGLETRYQFKTVGLDKDKEPANYRFGLPGVFLGFLAGLFGFVGAGFTQCISHCINSGVRSFKYMANLGSGEQARIQIDAYAEKDERDWFFLVAGSPGMLLGGLLGSLVLVTAYTGKWLENNYTSMLALGGSILNAGLGRVIFGGLASDTRDDASKALGILGYAVATLITPVAVLVASARIIMPAVITLPFAILGSVIVAPLKWWRLYNAPRFETGVVQDSNKLQKIKNLYSALDTWGYFPEDQPIAVGAGNKGPNTFARKSFTFDQSSMTELLLDEVLEKLKGNNQGLDVREIVADHFKTRCYEIPDLKDQINDIANFIEAYLEDEIAQVPNDLYSRHRNGFANTFFGIRKKGEKQVVGEEQKVNEFGTQFPVPGISEV